MGSHHEGDETKGSVYLFVQDYIEARQASGSVRTPCGRPEGPNRYVSKPRYFSRDEAISRDNFPAWCLAASMPPQPGSDAAWIAATLSWRIMFGI